jgi:hypothetical protein
LGDFVDQPAEQDRRGEVKQKRVDRGQHHCSPGAAADQMQPVGFGNPAILQACLAGPYGKSS